MTTRRPKYDEAINATRVSRSFRPTGIDCPFCGKKEIYVTHKRGFRTGLVSTVYRQIFDLPLRC